MNKKFKAFTLIELLVVIAIIGILSGFIVISMSGIINKANIAKNQVFSNSLRNALILNIVGEWNFDEESGTAVYDTWTKINNGTLNNFTNLTAKYGDTNTDGWMSSENCVSGTCLKFDGSNDYIHISNGFTDTISGKDAFTVEAWIYPLSLAGSGKAVWSRSGANNVIGSITTEGAILMRTGISPITTSNGIITINNWSHVVWTKINSTVGKIYVNGVEIAVTGSLSNTPVASEDFHIGAYNDANIGSFCWNGLIDNFRIYNVAVPASQIKEQYYAGLNKLLNNRVITQEEYQDRIGKLALDL